MKLVRVNIQQFRSIREMTIEFTEDCTVLLGINETGKSNIIRALSLLASGQTSTPDDVRQVRPDEAEPTESRVQFTLAPSTEDLEACRKALHDRTRGLASSVQLRDGDEVLDIVAFGARYAKTVLHTFDVPSNRRRLQHWAHGKEFGLDDGWLVPKPGVNANINVTGIGTVAPGSIPVFPADRRGSDVSDDLVKSASATDVEHLFWNVIHDVLATRMPECIVWSHAEASALPTATNFEEFAKNPSMAAALRNVFQLGGVADISSTLKTARTKTDGVRNLLDRIGLRASKYLRSLWAGSPVSIVLQENGPMLQCAVQDTHGVYDFQRRSDGFRRFASFLLMVSARAQAGQLHDALLLYDEPDASLHPAAARQLRDELLHLAERCKVVYSTHSIFMVDPDNVGRHLLVRRENEETLIERAKPGNIRDEEVLYQAIGHTIFADLREMNLLLEGYRDRLLLEVALGDPALGDRARGLLRVGRCHTRGVKNIPSVTAMLDLVRRSYVIVTDGDAPAVERKKEYAGAAPWLTYPELVGDPNTLTAEDFVAAERLRESLAATEPDCPELPRSLRTSLVADQPFMRQLDAALVAASVAKDRRKEISNAVKERVFAGLTYGHLRPSAAVLVEKLAGTVTAAMAASAK